MTTLKFSFELSLYCILSYRFPDPLLKGWCPANFRWVSAPALLIQMVQLSHFHVKALQRTASKPSLDSCSWTTKKQQHARYHRHRPWAHGTALPWVGHVFLPFGSLIYQWIEFYSSSVTTPITKKVLGLNPSVVCTFSLWMCGFFSGTPPTFYHGSWLL